MIFGFCVEKGSELPKGNPQRKFKGRVVFRGNQVRDEDHYMATFQDMGSAPASMASGKFCDFLGLLPNWRLMQADAVRAYTQALGQCVDAYKSLAGPDAKPMQKVSTPFLDESTAWTPPEGEPTRILRNVALKILMKILYASRMARPDILRATCMLARRVAKWCP